MLRRAIQHAGPNDATYSTGDASIPTSARFAHRSRRLTIRAVNQMQMAANDGMAEPPNTMTPDSRSQTLQLSTLLWISIAALAGVGVGASLFGNSAVQPDVAKPPVIPARIQSSPPEPQPHVVLESQIILKSPSALRDGGSHRVAIFNAGTAVLKMAQGAVANRLRVEVPPELAPGDVGHVTIAWWPIDLDAANPWRGWVAIQTNDPKNMEFRIVIAQDGDDPKSP